MQNNALKPLVAAPEHIPRMRLPISLQDLGKLVVFIRLPLSNLERNRQVHLAMA